MISRAGKFIAALTDGDTHLRSPSSQAKVNAQTIFVTLGAAIAASLVMRYFYADISPFLMWAHISIGIPYAFAAFYFRVTLNFATTTRAYGALALVVFTLVNWSLGGIASLALLCFVVPAFVSALVIGWRDGCFWLTVGCAITTVLFYLDHFYAIPISQVDLTDARIAALLYCFMIAVLIGLVSSFWVTRQKTIEELRTRNSENLTVKMKEVSDEKNHVNASPSESVVADWIEKAKGMDPLITH